MSDVRRGQFMHEVSAVADFWIDDPNGTHALMDWEEYVFLEEVRLDRLKEQCEEIERLRKVVDAVRPIITRWSTRGLGNPLPGEKPTDADLLNELEAALRELEGSDD